MKIAAGTKKRSAWKNILLAVAMSGFFFIPAGAEQKSKFALGLYSGWSVGLGDAFRWSGSGTFQSANRMNLHLGVYTQFNLSQSFGLRVDVDVQMVEHRWNSNYYGKGSNTHHFTSFDLNGVFDLPGSKNACFYFLGGAGVSQGESGILSDGIYFNLVGGGGVKIRLRSGRSPAFNLGATFHHLMDPNSSYHVDYLRLDLGVEFDMRREQDRSI